MRIFKFNPWAIGIIIAWARCFVVCIRISKLSWHNSTNFRIHCWFIFVWSRPRNLKPFRIIKPWPETIAWVLFASVFKDCILVVICSRTGNISFFQVISRFFWENMAWFLHFQFTFQIILSWAKFNTFHFRIASTIKSRFIEKLRIRRGFLLCVSVTGIILSWSNIKSWWAVVSSWGQTVTRSGLTFQIHYLLNKWAFLFVRAGTWHLGVGIFATIFPEAILEWEITYIGDQRLWRFWDWFQD